MEANSESIFFNEIEAVASITEDEQEAAEKVSSKKVKWKRLANIQTLHDKIPMNNNAAEQSIRG